jgi:hypothetical protein
VKCSCRKGARCLACIVRDGLIQKAQPSPVVCLSRLGRAYSFHLNPPGKVVRVTPDGLTIIT